MMASQLQFSRVRDHLNTPPLGLLEVF